ncbi:MAG: hypothetical protein GX960_09910 [Actinomycetales bacterium]|nr:hypothetical protein [Actinomycetales bacterium]
MDDETGPRRARVGASAMGAAALLVLSFGPSALALSPSSGPAPASSPRVVTSAPAAGASPSSVMRGSEDERATQQAEEA